MPAGPRRGLFWQIYPILLGSLLLVAVLGAVAVHLFGPPTGASMAMRMTGLRIHGLHMIGMLLAVAALIALAAWPVMARTTRRLEHLRRSVDAWGDGDLARRASVEGRDEVAAVAASFNAAADRVDALLAAHKALLAHASHELRSPLARIALAAEMLAGDDSAAARAIQGEIAELDALVGEILLASRLDHAADDLAPEPVDCLALAAEEAARVGVALAAVPPDAPPFIVDGSPRLLRRLIRNLLENALKHGAPPVEIALGHALADGRPAIQIAVTDHGPGLDEAVRERVFEPFFRPAGASESAGSWGLGLSLVRQIAERHGGAAGCASEAPLTRFAVTLPARETTRPGPPPAPHDAGRSSTRPRPSPP
jgi:signal transduction histidine kinase